MFLSAQESSNTEDMETAETSPSSGLGKEMFNIVYNIDCDPESFKMILSWLR